MTARLLWSKAEQVVLMKLDEMQIPLYQFDDDIWWWRKSTRSIRMIRQNWNFIATHIVALYWSESSQRNGNRIVRKRLYFQCVVQFIRVTAAVRLQHFNLNSVCDMFVHTSNRYAAQQQRIQVNEDIFSNLVKRYFSIFNLNSFVAAAHQLASLLPLFVRLYLLHQQINCLD